MNKYILIKKQIKEHFVLLNKVYDNIECLDKKYLNLEDELFKLNKSISEINISLKETGDIDYPLINIPQSCNGKKHILIVGFFGAFNLGDELMLETLLGYLKEYENKFDFTIMLSENYYCDITRYGAHNFIFYPKNILDLNNFANYFDIMISPGGALLDDVNYSINCKNMTLGTILINLSLRFIEFNKKCILYGLSTNDKITNKEYIEKLKIICEKSDYFSLRDNNSLTTLNNSGIFNDKIRIVDDIVITNNLLILSNKHKKTNNIGLIYVFDNQTYPRILSFTKKLLNYSNKDLMFNIIPFYDYNNNDITFASRLLRDLGNNRISISDPVPKKMVDTLEIINKNDCIISMRYHGTLISNFLHKKVLCINLDTHRHYNNKNNHIYHMYGFEKNIINYSNIEKFGINDYSKLINQKVLPVEVSNFVKEASDKIINILKDIIC